MSSLPRSRESRPRRSVSRSERIPTANSATRQDFSVGAKNHLTEDLIGMRRSSTKRLGGRCFAQSAIRIRFPRAIVGKDTPLLFASTLCEYPYQISPTESREVSSAPNQLYESSIQDTFYFLHIIYLSNRIFFLFLIYFYHN